MHRLKQLSLLLLLLLLPFQQYAQLYNYVHYTTHNGLTSNTVYCALQDSRGFMWFSTDAGVCVFDGKTFRQLTTANGLGDNDILNLFEDSKGRIWFLPFNGHLSYYYNDRIYNESSDSLLKGTFVGNSYRELFEDRSGNLWFLAIPNGCLKLTPDGKTSYHMLSRNVLLAYEEENGTLHIFSDQDHKLINDSFVMSPLPYKLNEFACFGDKEEAIYISGSKVVQIKNGKPNILYESDHIKSSLLTNIDKTRSGRIWVNSRRDGAYMIRDEYGNKSYRHFLPGKIIYTSYEDNEQNTWFTTMGEGVYLLKKSSEDVINFTTESGLSSVPVYSILKVDSSRILLGCSNATVSLIHNTKVINVRPTGPDFASKFNRINDIKRISNKSNRIFYSSDNGVAEIRIKNDDVLLQVCDVYDTIRKRINHDGGYGSAKALFPDTSGKLFVTMSFDVFEFKEKPVPHIYPTEIINKILRCYSHFFDNENTLWISVIRGLQKYQESIKLEWKGRTQWSRISQIRQAADSAIVLATEGDGLLFLKNDKVINHYSSLEGLPAGQIRKIYIDGSRIYIASNKGVGSIVYKNNGFSDTKHYTYDDGLLSNDVYDVFAENNLIYACTDLGLSVINEKTISPKSHPPNVYITHIKNQEKEVDINGGFTIPYDKVYVSFSFIAPTFKSPENVKYRYSLNKNVWTETRGNMVEFASLPPGSYTFSLKARKPDSDWSKPVTVNFEVLPAYWQTIWFWVLCTFVVLALTATAIIYIYRRNLERRIAAIEKREAVNIERARIASDLHDDLGSELTSIAIKADILKRSVDEHLEIHGHLNTISESSKGIIEKISEIIWAVNSSNDKLNNLISYLHEYAGNYFEKHSIQCETIFPSRLPAYALSAAYRRNIFLIIKESFHNIVKHSKATVVKFIMTFEEDLILKITITDNGVGFSNSNIRLNANGLINIKKRTSHLKGSMQVTSVEGKGTSICLVVPLMDEIKAENLKKG